VRWVAEGKLMCRWKDEWVVVGWVDLYVDGLVNR
jgi:hypothetical protein